MRGIFVVFLIVLCGQCAFADVVISEVMYNPEGADTKREWVEIFSDSSIDVSGWKFLENGVKHGLTAVQGGFLFSGYAVIVSDADSFLAEYPDFSGTLIDSSFSLSNTGEELAFLDRQLASMVSVVYSSEFGGDGDGSSLVFDGSGYVNGVKGGTPGYGEGEKVMDSGLDREGNESDEEAKRSVVTFHNESNASLEVVLDRSVVAGVLYSKLFKVSNRFSEKGRVNVTVLYRIMHEGQEIFSGSFVKEEVNRYSSVGTGIFEVSSVGEYVLCGKIDDEVSEEACQSVTVVDGASVLCDVSLGIDVDDRVFANNERISYRPAVLGVGDFPFSIRYGVVDLHGNSVRGVRVSENRNAKSFTPDISEIDRVYVIKMALESVGCNDTNLSDNTAEKLVVVNGSVASFEENSSVDIVSLSGDTQFGGVLKVRVKIYKGNERKYAIKARVINSEGRRVSDVDSGVNVYGKYKEVDVVVPVRLKERCESGEYTVVVEGLGVRTEKVIELGDARLCDVDGDDGLKSRSKEKDAQKKRDFVYYISGVDRTVDSGGEVETRVSFVNDDDVDHTVDLWSYVFRGRTSYSGERELNKKKVSIAAGDKQEVVLLNELSEEMESGEYTLRVKVRKDEQKTSRNLDERVVVRQPIADYEGGGKNSTFCGCATHDGNSTHSQLFSSEERLFLQGREGGGLNESVSDRVDVVYESVSARTRHFIPYLFGLFGILGVLSVILFFRYGEA